jgi:hypothetical protein
MVSPTTILACWGAGLSTIVFLWDIYKYRKAGPKLRFEVYAHNRMVPSSKQRVYIRSVVTNRGDRPTTLTNVVLYYFASRWSLARLRNLPTESAGANALLTSPEQALPYELKPGTMWSGMTEQTRVIEEWGSTGVLYFDLHHSHDTKPVRRRVRFPKPR